MRAISVISIFILMVIAVGYAFSKGSVFQTKSISIAANSGFDFPVGKPDAKGYYNAQGFGKNDHLGDDWNGVKGGNSDFGDPIYATANGRVVHAYNIMGGWGKVIRIEHYWIDHADTIMVESLYAHMDSVMVNVGDVVKKGQKIGTIGNADGIYLAHLHFEIRDRWQMPIGGGYSKIKTGYLDPTSFIKTHRRLP